MGKQRARALTNDPGADAALPKREVPAPTWEWEARLWEKGWTAVAGVDEAGRGPLAGPVVAAAVVLPREIELTGVHDSKRLDAAERERIYEAIRECAVCWSVAVVDHQEIDRINILRATHAAMAQALAALEPTPHGALVDGLPVQGLPCPHQAIVSGDALCVSIAAASILAKVSRDRIMVDLDEHYPGYGFARHKGYSTPEHLAALSELGPSPCHRRSFRPVALLTEGPLSLFAEDDR
jgi:ribonuclease HII